MLRSAVLATASAWVLMPQASLAQTSTQSGAQNIPSVTVTAPEARRRAAATSPQRRVTRTSVQTPARNRPQPRREVGFVETPRGPVNGYVAGRSSSGTKTNTPIMETPQAVSVIGAEQIRDQKPNKLDEIVRYSPGIHGETYGADNRNDWFQIRGFKAEDVGLFLDGLQLFYTSYASWKLQPFNLERVEILRGPSAVLYGGSNPGGIVNAISKTPPAEPVRYLEAGVNNFGNTYLSFDFGGPVATATEPGKLFYRVIGQVKGGGTQVDFTPDNNYFIAPSFTWKPDEDTSFTVLASASKYETRSLNFLPYVGTVVNAPWGKIPTSLFASDPSVDTFQREQEMIGYRFERNLSDNVTVRQNARFAHVDVTLSTLYGLGYLTTPAAANLNRGNFLTHGIANQANLDNQVEYRFATGPLQHTSLFGVDLKHYKIDDWQGFGAATPLNLLNPTYTPTARFAGAPYQNATLTQRQVGVYAQDQIRLDRLTLVLSGRNDWVDTDNDNHIGSSMGRNDSAFSGRAGLIYNFDNGIAPYVSYATSFNPIIGTNFTLNQLYLPETARQAEVGLKYQPLGFDGHFGVALFDLKRDNVLTTDPNNALLSVQTGQVTSRGIELEAVANVMPGLKVIASHTVFDIFVSRDLNSALIGKAPTNTPSQLTSGWADYTIQSGPLAGLGFGGGIRYVGKSYADNMNTLEVPAYLLGDAAVHYEWQGWRYALNVSNVTDKTFVGSCSSPTACFYGDRRRVTASVSYKW
ncbi:TonB-dependent siderophore receptor [Bradyrhizobium glycinis]|nr:TonB-dependent siderophore receptor [Bradyrhizobium glycinis]MBH5369986.1 TonB-dependent siderophore receptor [Bradyrhizobium glycinis]